MAFSRWHAPVQEFYPICNDPILSHPIPFHSICNSIRLTGTFLLYFCRSFCAPFISAFPLLIIATSHLPLEWHATKLPAINFVHISAQSRESRENCSKIRAAWKTHASRIYICICTKTEYKEYAHRILNYQLIGQIYFQIINIKI